MRLRIRHLHALGIALAIGAGALLCAGIAMNANERARRGAQRHALGAELSRTAERLRGAADSLAADARACTVARAAGEGEGQRFAWPLDGGALAGSSAALRPEHRPVAHALQRALTAEPARRLLGPFPAADGREYFVARAAPPGDARGCAAGAALDRLLAQAGVFRLLRTGVDLRLADQSSRVFFESRAFAEERPEQVAFQIADAHWNLRAQPHDGWAQGGLVRWTLLFLIGATVATAAYFFQKRSDNYLAEVGVLYERLHNLGAHLSDVLREHEHSEQRALALAQLDGGTGLPNRQSTIQAFDLHLSQSRARRTPAITVYVVQLQSLPELEKALGRTQLHHAMREAATRLTALDGIGGNIGRIGDIELAFWLDIESTSMEAETLAARASEALSLPFEIGRTTAHVSFGIGLASQPEAALSGEELLEQAGAAAEDAVRRRSGAWRRFEPGTRAHKIDQLRIETELRRALEGEGLTLHYQPILGFDSQRLAGFEALIRWQHPLQGLLLPAAFLPVAEHAHMLLDIDRWVMRQAVLQARQWDLELDRDYYISINISPQHFSRLSLVDELSALLREHAVSPKRIRLEIVENALVSDMETAIAVATALRAQGMQLCLDDFGTGYSSLGYLRSLPLDAIKVDRFFVERMVTDTRDFGLVKTIIDLARYLEVYCVVEGVSTNEQHELLSVLTPDFAQGHLYSKPVTAARAEQMLRGVADKGAWREAS